MADRPYDATIARIDAVLARNARIEWLFLVLATLLFGTGIATMVVAIVSANLVWATPGAMTTGLLYWPLKRILQMRRENIALGVAPVLIRELEPWEAARELRALLAWLYGDTSELPRLH